MSLTKTITRSFLGMKTMVAIALAGWILFSGLTQTTTDAVIQPPTSVAQNYGRPNAVGSPAEMMVTHKCWAAHQPPLAKIPGHAIIRTDSLSDARLVGPAGTGQAMEHIFSGRYSEMVVVAFCV